MVGNLEWFNCNKEKAAEIDRLNGERLELEELLRVSEEERVENEKIIAKQSEQILTLTDQLANTSYELLQYEYIGEYTVTAYCCEKYPHICGGGKTASGTDPIPNLTCAVTDLKTFPYGTIIYIENVGIRIVQDTGGFHSNKIDVAVETHEEAVRWQNKKRKVWIIKENKE